MSSRAAIGILALAGCNQIFGLEPVGLLDAGSPEGIDGPLERVRLNHQIASTQLTPPAVIAEPVLELAPIRDLEVRVAELGKGFTDASYDLATGEVEVPLAAPFATRWRLEYTLPPGPPHELSWTPEAGVASVVVPVVGRLERGVMPPGSGYDVRPTGVTPTPPAPGTFNASHIFTTGVFLDAATGTSPADSKLDLASTRFDGTVRGAPDQVRGDFAVVVNYTLVGGSCILLSNGFAGFRPPALVAAQQATPSPQPTWSVSTTTTLGLTYLNFGALGTRMIGALGTRSVGNTSVLEHGFVANADLFAYTTTKTGSPSPLLFPLATCNLDPAVANTTFVTPIDLEGFPRATYARLSNQRSVGNGAQLVSSIVTLAGVVGGTSIVDFGIPLASSPVLTAGPETFPLDGASEDVRVPAGAGTLDLKFALEAETGGVVLAADYFEVTLFRIEGATLVPVRVYLTTDIAAAAIPPHTITNPIAIDRSLFQSGMSYVLAIKTVRGRPNVERGDFATVEYPQAIATTFTRTILVP